eukprot:scaffold3664_cov407-Prasinococcus_capsulatus_cf.AAC.1
MGSRAPPSSRRSCRRSSAPQRPWRPATGAAAAAAATAWQSAPSWRPCGAGNTGGWRAGSGAAAGRRRDCVRRLGVGERRGCERRLRAARACGPVTQAGGTRGHLCTQQSSPARPRRHGGVHAAVTNSGASCGVRRSPGRPSRCQRRRQVRLPGPLAHISGAGVHRPRTTEPKMPAARREASPRQARKLLLLRMMIEALSAARQLARNRRRWLRCRHPPPPPHRALRSAAQRSQERSHGLRGCKGRWVPTGKQATQPIPAQFNATQRPSRSVNGPPPPIPSRETPNAAQLRASPERGAAEEGGERRRRGCQHPPPPFDDDDDDDDDGARRPRDRDRAPTLQMG